MIRVPVYAPADAPVTVTAQLLNRKGQAMRSLATKPVAGQSPLTEIDLPLAGFAAGEYRVEIVAKTPTTATTDVLDLRITN